jgi:arylsulfatase A
MAALLVTQNVPAESLRPNVVILYADDMGYGDLAIQNPDSKILTPHLDQLAREGLRFTDAHSSSGVCSPSRYALLTGRYHWRKFHGVVASFGPSVLDAAELTLPELLKTAGYRTACIGKWHLGWDWSAVRRAGAEPTPDAGYAPDAFDWSKPIPGGPLAHGFDYYFGDEVPNFPPYAWFENDRVITPPTVSLSITAKTAEGEWEARPGPAVANWDFYAVPGRLLEKTVEWIGRQSVDQPFFLFVPFNSPHAPIVPSAEFAGTSKAGGYGDFMEQTDAAVGRILEALEAGGFSKNTLVIFSSDNGPERYAYERVRNFGHRSMGPLRGLKRDLWEGGHRVPLIVRWPGKVPAGAATEGLISQIDLFATLASMVGYRIAAGAAEDSVNQLDLWLGHGPSARSTLVHDTAAGIYAVRHGDWLYIDHKTGGITPVPAWFDQENGYAPNPHVGELYNLREDLGQKRNLFVDHPEKVAELKARLASIRGSE